MSQNQPQPENERNPRDEKIRLALFQGLSFGNLVLESLMPLLGWLLLVAGLFLSVAWLDVLPDLPVWLHGLVLALFAVLTLWLVWHGFRRFRLPAWRMAARRLEQDSRVSFQPLEAIQDRPADGSDPAALVLWDEHQRRARKAAEKLVPGTPRLVPPLGRAPLAPRAALLCLFMFALASGTGDWGARFERALTPGAERQAVQLPARLDLWISPPAYTGLPPVFLESGQMAGAVAAPAGAATSGDATATADGDGSMVRVPVNSVLKLRVSGGQDDARLSLDQRKIPLIRDSRDSQSLTLTLEEGRALAVKQGEKLLGAWTLELVPDQPPEIAFADPPGQTERHALVLSWALKDDYGVSGVLAEIRLEKDKVAPHMLDFSPELLPGGNFPRHEQPDPALPQPDSPQPDLREGRLTPGADRGAGVVPASLLRSAESEPFQEGTDVLPGEQENREIAREVLERRLEALSDAPLILPVTLPAGGLREGQGTAWFDLTMHEWAGLPVSIHLLARDAAGQEGRSETVSYVLPLRTFNDPVARALIEARRILALSPDQRLAIAGILMALNEKPDLYHGDLVVRLALRVAARRLQAIRPHQKKEMASALASARQLLWETALHLEDGGVTLAAGEMRQLQDELMQALDQGQSGEELERLMDDMQSSLDRFLEAMARNAGGNQQMRPAPGPLPENARMIDRSQLQEMMNQIRELSRAGATEAAREMLSRMQQIMENIQVAPSMAGNDGQQGQPGEPGQGMSPGQAMDMMGDLDEVLQQQQGLLDRTFRTSRAGEGQRERRPSAQQNMMQQFQRFLPPGMPGLESPGGQRGQPFPSDRQTGPFGNQRMTRQDLERMLRGETPLPGSPFSGQGSDGDDQARNGPGGEQDGQEAGRGATGQSSGNGAGSSAGAGNTGQAQAAEQEALRRRLGDIMRRFGEAGGEIPSGLGQAERSMRQAGRELGQDRFNPAIESQQDAIESLQRGLQQMTRQLMEQMARGGSGSGNDGAGTPNPGGSPGGNQPSRDPLGRASGPEQGGGLFSDRDVNIPDEAELQRARDILRELRRRSSQHSRSRPEKDYLRRLMERF